MKKKKIKRLEALRGLDPRPYKAAVYPVLKTKKVKRAIKKVNKENKL